MGILRTHFCNTSPDDCLCQNNNVMEMLTVKVENNSGLDYRLRFLAAHFESKCCMPGLTIQ